MEKESLAKPVITILSLEDSPLDYEIIREILSGAGYHLQMDLAANKKEYTALLRKKTYDIILSDFKLPGYDAFAALQTAQKICPLVPFICVSGTIGEETAIELIKQGAVDYVLKDRMDRLPFVVNRAINEAKEKQARKQAEENFRSQAKFASENPNPVLRVDRHGILLYANAAAFSRMPCWKLQLGQTIPAELHKLTQNAEKMGVKQVDVSCGERHFSIATAYSPQEGYVNLYATDITERKKIDDQLKDSEFRYHNFFDNSIEFLFTLDIKGNFTDVNKAAEYLTGYTKAELLKMNFKDYSPNSEHRNLFRALHSVYKTGKPIQNIPVEATIKDQSKKYFETSFSLLKKGGQIIGFQGSSMDVTERKRAEMIQTAQYNIAQAMVRATDLSTLFPVVKNELKQLIDAKNFVLALYDEKNGLIHAPYENDEKNEVPPYWKAEKSMTGQVILQNRSILIKKADFEQMIKNGEVERIGTIPEVWLGIPLLAEKGVVGAIVLQNYNNPDVFNEAAVQLLEMIAHGMGSYISRKQTEADRERLNAAIEQSAELVVITDKMGNINYVNPAFEKVTGYTRAEAVGKTPRILKSGEQDQDFYKQLWDTISSGQVWKGKLINRRKNDTLFTEESTISPVFDTDGNISNFVAVKRDITKEQQLEEQFQQAQKMESIGRLAGGIAHDFNNMLSVIIGYSEMALRKLDSTDKLHGDIQEINNAGQRSADLTTQLLAFARKQTIAPRVLDINDTVTNMLNMLRRLIGEDIDLAWIPGANLGAIHIDPAQIDQILANLCVNARDAIQGVGRVTIETRNFTFDDAYCQTHLLAEPGAYVMLAVSDDGRGMNSETVSQVFEPFFTTKAPGEGTGLGLATVYGIVKQNNGWINVYSEPGHGTTFKIYIPRHLGSEAEIHAETAVDIPKGNGQRIFLVEDESAILHMTHTMLESIGYSVIAASSPRDALRLMGKQQEKVELLISDVVMPGLNGKELATKLLGIRPEMKVLFMSGYTANAIAHRGVLDEGVNFINKPFSLPQLAAKIKEVLNS